MNEVAFLSALHEAPDDDVTWLALADWLEEDGQPQRAELIRLVRQLRALPVGEATEVRALEGRVVALINANVRPAVPEVVNSVGMRLALLPPGRTRMGSPSNETMRSDDEVVHQVQIDQPFYLGVFPVTQEEFRRVTRRSPSQYRRGGSRASDVADVDTSRFPVENVTWDDAVAFCQRLSERNEERQAGRTYRLPTEAEWEYACRAAGTSLTAFAFGPSLCSTQANFDGHHPSGGAEEGPTLRRPCGVGSYKPNAWGLHDVHGNVWEWCQDVYESYQSRGTQTPPETGERVVRGGAYYNDAAWCRSARRGRVGSSSHHGHLGFRVAADWPFTPGQSVPLSAKERRGKRPGPVTS
jgi:formylglycine-generating enzyme